MTSHGDVVLVEAGVHHGYVVHVVVVPATLMIRQGEKLQNKHNRNRW